MRSALWATPLTFTSTCTFTRGLQPPEGFFFRHWHCRRLLAFWKGRPLLGVDCVFLGVVRLSNVLATFKMRISDFGDWISYQSWNEYIENTLQTKKNFGRVKSWDCGFTGSRNNRLSSHQFGFPNFSGSIWFRGDALYLAQSHEDPICLDPTSSRDCP